MIGRIQYMLGVSLILSGIFPVSAQTHDKSFYNITRVKADNPWIKTHNGSGLMFNRFRDYSYAEAGFQYEEGNYRNVSDPTSVSNTKIVAESFRSVNKVCFYGNFTFDYAHRQNKTWSNVLYPYNSLMFLADSVPGRQTLESYHLDAGMGLPVGKHWGIGVLASYEAASNAKKKDVRNKNEYMEFELYPGMLFRSGYVNAGVNFIYQRRTETIELYNYGDFKNHEIFAFEGMWFYTSKLEFNTAGNRDYKENTYGGSAQLEFHGKKFSFLNQFSGAYGKQSIFRNFTIDERGGEIEKDVYKYLGAVRIDGGNFHHHVNISASFDEMYGYENIQQLEVVDQASIWVQYGRKNKSVRKTAIYDINYTLFKDRSFLHNSWNAAIGVKGFNVENKYRLYPIEYTQDWRNTGVYAAFNKNFRIKTGMIDCGVKFAYSVGGGTMFEIKGTSGDTAGEDIYKQRKDLLFREYEYMTADRLAGDLSFRYTYHLDKEKGMALYADLNGMWKQAQSGYFKHENWTTLRMMFGLSF